jgi:hypothetical protein
MPVQQVDVRMLPKSIKSSKVIGSSEYAEIQKLLPNLPKEQALRITLSPETVKPFKDLKTAVSAFRQKLLSEYKEHYRIGVIGTELIVKHKTADKVKK